MGREHGEKGSVRRSAAKLRAPRQNGWVDVEAVTDLIRLMDENRLVELEIANGDSRIRLVRARAGGGEDPAPVTAEAIEAKAPPVPIPASDARGRSIISPMVGTFYRAASPDAPPFVEVGSIVEKGDTLCIIEAMKMMNEIEAEFRGRVTRVIADNGQTIEYGEELFLIEPL